MYQVGVLDGHGTGELYIMETDNPMLAAQFYALMMDLGEGVVGTRMVPGRAGDLYDFPLIEGEEEDEDDNDLF